MTRRNMLWIVAGGAIGVVARSQTIDTDQRGQAARREVVEQRQRFVNASYLLWMNALCGVCHDRLKCYRQAWPGSVYPTEPLPGETGAPHSDGWQSRTTAHIRCVGNDQAA